MIDSSPDPTAAPKPARARLALRETLPALSATALRVVAAQLPAIAVAALRVLAALLATAALGAYLWLALVHLRYPFELEWMEGGMVDEIRRAAAGQSLYVTPSVEYVPFIYGPLYFYVAAAFSKVLGLSLFSARLVSVLASLGVLGLIVRFVQREGGSAYAGYLGAGLFAGTYKLASAFYDLARVDSLSVFLLLAGLYVLRFRDSRRARVAAAAIFTLAFHAKQSTVLVFAPVALHVLLAERRRGLWFAGAGAALMGGSVVILDRIHGGWFTYFVFWLPRQHPWVKRMWIDFWTEDLLAPLALSMALGLAYVMVNRGVPGRRFYFFAAAGMLGTSWTGRLHAGGWPNVIAPGFAVIALLFGLGLAAGLHAAEKREAPRRRSAQAFLLALASVQFLVLAYDPRRFVPTPADAAAGRNLLAQIRATEGDVFMPGHGHLATLAGKRPFAHEMAIGDILGIGRGKPGVAALHADLVRAFAEKRFGGVIVDNDFFKREIEENYRRKADAITGRDVFWPVTGMRTRPRTIYVTKTK